jgi:hypothetical protein
MWKSIKEFIPSFGKWWWAVAIDYLAGIAGVYQSVTGTTTLSKVSWGVVFALAFAIPPLIAFHLAREGRDKLQNDLDDIKNARPNIVCAGTQNIIAPIREVATGRVVGEPCFTHVLFSNDPTLPLQAVDAPNVVGHIDIRNESGEVIYADVIGRWAETKEEATGGQPNEMEQITLPANARPNPLDIIMKYRGDENCYLLTNAGRRRAPSDWRDKEKQLGKASYLVRVRLRSNNVDSQFWFKLVNGGNGAGISLEVLASEPSVVHKGDSQT